MPTRATLSEAGSAQVAAPVVDGGWGMADLAPLALWAWRGA
jgi:hypothetical protein